ncbi:hypothetical protein Pint_28648 [Pistacia integerrima]|uniref:Uncharacterized protein n=1 Tax=Pistacia integerrima TaxID=434235 RepID=A0ACC0YUB5_9ROSI|nr:hypothetical protein Pint_28648 [Pistacia integerrima]
MLSSFVSFFNRDQLSYQILEHREPKPANFIYRDNLNKNKKQKLSPNQPKDDHFCFASSKPIEEKGVIRVKVTMTKKEAARLLSKCKEGGVLGFKDVANELVQIPMNRVSVESTPCASSHAVLKSIPE